MPVLREKRCRSEGLQGELLADAKLVFVLTPVSPQDGAAMKSSSAVFNVS
jgi:hypothetical protein